ncbi:hypothetical protein EV384_2930 [Micromonospora kangleipakensis]|uniref:Uncharacterized protein n=1 Tax=Micromonospora kangleipakensis TaxID=1077942 RepID=A0A4Q8BBJ0_9ACTN|nr:hypothetical protein [Micromonospora kangleipakensis]RZU74463.1 hypothetical protein EV384_2930 [Micromonospora kangleipakensis]
MQTARVVGWLGLAAHLALAIWYAASGLVVPAWAVAGLLLVWLVLLAVAIRLLRQRPALVPLVPLSAGLIWLAVVSAGDVWLGWTA